MYTLQSILNWNNNIFDGINVSDFNSLITDTSVPPLEEDTLVSNIILRCGLLQPVYGEPLLLQAQITLWWKSNYRNFYDIWRALHLNYSPIENYDRYESSVRKVGKEGTAKDSGTDTERSSGDDVTKNTGSDTTHSAGTDTSTDAKQDVTTNTVSAFNATDYQPKNETTIAYGKENTYKTDRDTTIDYGGISTVTHGMQRDFTHGKQSEFTENQNEGYETHIHGNIGVTTNQQMINQELLLRQKNAYEYFADNFEQNICITVY